MASVWKSREGAEIVRKRYEAALGHWPGEYRAFHVPTRQGDTFVIESGPADASPLVLLHGTASNSASWMVDAADWHRHFRLVCIDIIGDAGLSAEVRPPLDTDDHARWLDDVLAARGINNAAFVGTSLGGWMALDYAVRRPGRVNGLVLFCPGGVGRNLNILLWALPLLLLGPWGQRKLTERIGGKRTEPLSETQAAIASLLELTFAHFVPRRSNLPQVSDEALRSLTMPVLAILGGKDVFIDSLETRQRLEANVRNLTVRFLPEAPHFIPGQTVPVRDFLLGGAVSA